MRKSFLFLSFALALGLAGLLPSVASAGVAATFPNAAISESFNFPNGQYTVQVDNSQCCTPSTSWGLFAFAVENDTAFSTSTLRPGWSSMLANQSSWDAGIDLGPITTGGSRAFTNYFNASDIVALYFNDTGTDIGLASLIETDDRFFWNAAAPASVAVSFLQFNGQIFEDIDETLIVTAPEPLSMAVLGFGLVGLGVLRRRRG